MSGLCEVTMMKPRSGKYDSNYNIPVRYSWIKGLSNDDINYLSDLPYTIAIPSHKALIVHARIVPEQQQRNSLTNTRNIDEPDHIFSYCLTSTNKGP